MNQLKLIIVSLDLMLALPILSVALFTLFASINSSQRYLLEAAHFQNGELAIIAVSQKLAQYADASTLNYSATLQGISNISSSYGVVVALLPVGSQARCYLATEVCRLVTVSGSAYLLVVRHESAN